MSINYLDGHIPGDMAKIIEFAINNIFACAAKISSNDFSD